MNELLCILLPLNNYICRWIRWVLQCVRNLVCDMHFCAMALLINLIFLLSELILHFMFSQEFFFVFLFFRVIAYGVFMCVVIFCIFFLYLRVNKVGYNVLLITMCCKANNSTEYDKNSSWDETANVNFYAVHPEDTRIRWNNANNGHYAVQGHSRSPILIPIESSCNLRLPLVININLPPILHRFRDIAFDRSKIAIFGYPSLR